MDEDYGYQDPEVEIKESGDVDFVEFADSIADGKDHNAYVNHCTEFDPEHATVKIVKALENNNVFSDCPYVIEVGENIL